MNMNAEQAIQILKPMQSMMRDQNGCPISDAYFALEKAIEALEKKVDAVERKKGRWIPIIKGERGYSASDFRCSVCGDPCKCYHLTNFCPNCGAEMRKGEEG